MARSSGYFSSVEDAFSGQSAADELSLLYESPSGHTILCKAVLGGRIVVLKGLKPEYVGDGLWEAVLRHEYEISSPLKHPGICDTLSWINILDKGNFIVLEWVDGSTLTRLLETSPLAPDKAMNIAQQLCDALSYLHHKQVIHNDLKPDNILVTSDGSVVKIIDFSLADSPSMMGGHLPSGTVGFAAPEVASGGQASIASDIYSLGRVLSLLLPSRKDIVDRCCREVPSARFSSATEVRKALEQGHRRSILLPVVAALLILAACFAAWVFRGAGKVRGYFRDALVLVDAAMSDEAGFDASGYRFSDTLDCFNGRYIVSCDEGKGLMDKDGKLLIEPIWDAIVFLSPNVAMLSKGALCSLCDERGRIFAQGTDRQELEEASLELYENLLYEDIRTWDGILDDLDSLTVADVAEAKAQALYERISAELQSATGRMSRGQEERLRSIRER